MVRIDRQEEGEARVEKVRHLARRYGRILHANLNNVLWQHSKLEFVR